MAAADGSDGRLRILWVAKGLDVGGVERLLSWMGALHDRTAFHIELAYLPRWGTALAAEIQATGVQLHPLRALHETDVRWALQLRRLLLEKRYDVLHAQTPYVAFIARLVVRSLPRSRRPVTVSTEHNVWADYLAVTRLANASTFHLDAAHVAVSKRVQDSIPRRLVRDVVPLVHGIPLADAAAWRTDRAAVRQHLDLADETFVVGSVASLRPAKGHRELMHAARQVLDRGHDVVFLVMGSGPQEAELRRLHRRLRLGPAFRFLGFRSDAVRLLAGCDAFALASHHEGGPLSVLEALAIGLPVVATDVGVVPEVVRDGVDGFVVPISRPTELARALSRLIEEPGMRSDMAAAAAARSSDLEIATTVRQVEGVYRSVTS